jgi:hypothetical protein
MYHRTVLNVDHYLSVVSHMIVQCATRHSGSMFSVIFLSDVYHRIVLNVDHFLSDVYHMIVQCDTRHSGSMFSVIFRSGVTVYHIAQSGFG